jgi:hypothetical protein
MKRTLGEYGYLIPDIDPSYAITKERCRLAVHNGALVLSLRDKQPDANIPDEQS